MFEKIRNRMISQSKIGRKSLKRGGCNICNLTRNEIILRIDLTMGSVAAEIGTP
jgi:hypothetical protein